MDLIMALLIGFVLFGRWTNEKYETMQARKKYEEEKRIAQDILKSFQERYTDYNLEHHVLNDEAKYRRIVREIQVRTGIQNPKRILVLMIAMAEYGKIPADAASGDICVSRNQKNKKEREEYMQILRFMDMYNKLLHRNGVKEDLLILPYTCDPSGKPGKYTLPIRTDVPPMYYSSAFFWDIIKLPAMSIYTVCGKISL